jgi:hypothetical protein
MHRRFPHDIIVRGCAAQSDIDESTSASYKDITLQFCPVSDNIKSSTWKA